MGARPSHGRRALRLERRDGGAGGAGLPASSAKYARFAPGRFERGARASAAAASPSGSAPRSPARREPRRAAPRRRGPGRRIVRSSGRRAVAEAVQACDRLVERAGAEQDRERVGAPARTAPARGSRARLRRPQRLLATRQRGGPRPARLRASLAAGRGRRLERALGRAPTRARRARARATPQRGALQWAARPASGRRPHSTGRPEHAESRTQARGAPHRSSRSLPHEVGDRSRGRRACLCVVTIGAEDPRFRLGSPLQLS